MKTVFRNSALTALAAAAALSFASPASAAMVLNANGTVTVTGTGGGTVVLNMGGNSGGVDYSGLSSSVTLTFVSAVDGKYTFSYILSNTTVAPITSRLNAFAFDTSPDVLSVTDKKGKTELVGAEVTSGSTLSNIKFTNNFPNGIGNVEICLTTHNCTGGGSDGLSRGQSGAGGFILDFGPDNLTVPLILSNFAVRYQALTLDGKKQLGEGSGTGRLITTPVPEPGTWALMLVGFGAIGFSMRRRRRLSALSQMA